MSESTKISPFFANTGWDPRITTDLNQPARGDVDDARAHRLASKMAEIHEFARTSMIDAQLRYQDQADNQRTTAPRFRLGDLVWFLSKNMRSVRLSRKLDHKREGPFRIMEDPNLKTPYPYKVEFPADIRVHPVRHISELEPAADGSYPGQVALPPPQVEIEGEEEWEVEEVLDAKIRYRKLQYLIKWTDYDIPDWCDAVTPWSGACLKVGFLVAPGAEKRVRARAVTRVQWGFGSPQMCGNDSGSVWIRVSGSVWIRVSGSG